MLQMSDANHEAQVATISAAHKGRAARFAAAPHGPEAAGAAPLVIAQLGQSLDGRIATVSGESKYINGPHALDHLHALRAAVDAVVVGVGTVVADDPLLTVRRVEGKSPARVVIDPSGRADPRAKCFQADGARRVVLRRPGATGRLAPGVEVAELEGEGAFAPAAILQVLGRLGFRRVLVEGGARTLSAFIAAGCVHSLHVFVSPVILGSGRPGLELPGRETLAAALRPPAVVRVFPDGDVLFECDLQQCDLQHGLDAVHQDAVDREAEGGRDAGRTNSALRAAG